MTLFICNKWCPKRQKYIAFCDGFYAFDNPKIRDRFPDLVCKYLKKEEKNGRERLICTHG